MEGIATHPITVSFMAKPAVEWGSILQENMSKQYPDMQIEVIEEKDGNIVLRINFKNREAEIDDVRRRLYDFLVYTPAMKMQNLELKAAAH